MGTQGKVKLGQGAQDILDTNGEGGTGMGWRQVRKDIPEIIVAESESLQYAQVLF